jgi:hypothetical protein
MFTAWDGEETRDAGYCLFGASVDGAAPDASTTLQRPHLRSADMLDLLLEVASANPGAYHVAYSFDYDVNWFLRDFSWPELITLRIKGAVNWNGYRIEHIPHKIFKVECDGFRVRVDDIFSFFRTRYDKALQKYEISEPWIREQITRGKDNRADFRYADIPEIREYWSLELTTMCQLMDQIETMARKAGFTRLKQWHGPGALAAYSLREHKTEQHMKASPAPVLRAALRGYAGGWFERFQCGYHTGWVGTADINSAYVYAMSLLPDLAQGHWSYTSGSAVPDPKSTRFGLFHVKWRADYAAYMRACHGVPFPLFHRDNDGSIRRPLISDVWVWNPEAANCVATGYAEITEAWVLEDDGTYPFAWVADMYRTRLDMQRRGDPAEKILKWAMASYYGRFAQRTGWDKEKHPRPPRFHQIEYAGWITSWCRAAIYRAALDVGIRGGLVSVDTDGIISTVPFGDLDRGIGDGLGQWKTEEYDALIYIQNGVYWLRKDGVWEDPKLRGIPHVRMSPDVGLAGLRGDGTICLDRHGFVGYGLALGGRRDEWRSWSDSPLRVSAVSAGSRVHTPRSCRACKRGQRLDEALHDLMLVPNRDPVSKPHRLPWIDGDSKDGRLSALLAREQMLQSE